MPLPRILTLGLALALAVTAAACSKKAERIVGNDVLARGPDGLGSTARAVSPLDRDTYLGTGTANRGGTLVAGDSGGYEARILIKVGTWVLPDTNDASVVVDSIRLELPIDTTMSIPSSLFLQLHTAASAWDTMAVEWPGPSVGTAFASADVHNVLGDFGLEIGSSNFGLVKSWATDPASLHGFVVRRISGTGIAGFKADAGRVRIVYHTGTSTRAVADTPLAANLFIHSPLAPATGAETTLILGGLYEPVVALRAPIGTFTPGFSLDEARIVFRVRTPGAGAPTFPASVEVIVEARRVQNSWSEAAADTAGLGVSTTYLDRVLAYQVRDESDTLLVVPLPAALVRDWSAGVTANEGVVLRIGDSFKAPEIWLYSRESSRPPEFRISTTAPPPGRF